MITIPADQSAPECFNLEDVNREFIQVNRKNPLFVKWLLSNYEDVIDCFEGIEQIKICDAMASVFSHAGNNAPTDKISETYYQALLRTSRMGISLMRNLKKGEIDILHDQRYVNKIIAFLNYHFISLNGCNRPYAAIGSTSIIFRFNNLLLEQLKKGKLENSRFTKNVICNQAIISMDVTKTIAKYMTSFEDKDVYQLCVVMKLFLEDIMPIYEDLDVLMSDKLKEAIDLNNSLIETFKEIVGDDFEPEKISDDYTRWCYHRGLLINLGFNIFKPTDMSSSDNISFDIDERRKIMFSDITYTFDHCRRILYDIEKNHKGFEKEGRTAVVENIIDCYIRLYSTLDKLAQIGAHMFPVDLEEAPNFYSVCERFQSSHNRFLRAIFDVKEDLFPSINAKRGGYQTPVHYFADAPYSSSFIRNSIIHGTFRIVEPNEENYIQFGVAAITPSDLLLYTKQLMNSVKEIIVLLKLAEIEDKDPDSFIHK